MIPLFFWACAENSSQVEILGNFWPEGASISILKKGQPVFTTNLYGERVTAPLQGTHDYAIRVGSPEYLTAVTEMFQVRPGKTAHLLAAPVSRRKIGRTAFFLGSNALDDKVLSGMVEEIPESFTGLLLSDSSPGKLAPIVRKAHSRAVEVTVYGDAGCQESFVKSIRCGRKLISNAVSAGADGVQFIPDVQMARDTRFVESIRKLASEAHGWGMTFAVGFLPEWFDFRDPAELFTGSASGSPDELVLLCYGTGVNDAKPAVISVEQIETTLQKVRDAGIPLSRVSVELRAGGMAWEMDEQSRRPVRLGNGDLERVIEMSGTESVIRLGDGSGTIATGGTVYLWDDSFSLTSKMTYLWSGEFSRLRGIRILYDGTGVRPDPGCMRQLVSIMER